MKEIRTGEDYSTLEAADTLNNYLKYEGDKLQESITGTQVYNSIKIAIKVLEKRKELNTSATNEKCLVQQNNYVIIL